MANIFNIPASISFLDSLAVWASANFTNLADVKIFLPTRRSVLELRKIFINMGVEPIPQIEPLGDIELEKLLPNFEIPKPIAETNRIISLAKLVEAKDEKKTLQQAVYTAKSLLRLLDEVQSKECSLNNLNEIVADEFAEHWQLTLDFLEIITADWQRYKLENNILEPVERRNLLLKQAAEFYANNPPKQPIIIAGTTGTIPATIKLISSILQSENGYLILRGLDNKFSDREFISLPENHPQYNLSYLLTILKTSIGEVKDIVNIEDDTKQNLISTAMLPINKIEEWQSFDFSNPPQNLELIECEDVEQEASVIAFIVREAIENGANDINIISNNNKIFKRIQAKLKVWDISSNLSKSENLAATEQGKFLTSLAQMCESGFSAIKFLSFFKQKIIADEVKQKIYDIEITELRGLSLEDFQPWEYGIEYAGMQDFASYFKKRTFSFGEIFNKHIELAKNISGDAFFDDNFQEHIDNIKQYSEVFGDIDPLQYSGLLRDLLSQIKNWEDYETSSKVKLLPPIEARLLNADLTIITDLNDGSFPQLSFNNEFFNNTMRKSIGLDSADKNIGQQAHDFELLSKQQGRVVYTRSLKSGNGPTQKSRFLENITALTNLKNGAKYKHWVKQFYTPENISACAQPAPCPPLSARPSKLSVTKIGMLMRDPYAVYAEKILRLKKLDKLDRSIDASDFGNFVHGVIEDYYKNPDGQLQTLLNIGKLKIIKFKNNIGVEVFWWPRFVKVANWLIQQHEPDAKIYHEISENYKFNNFEITAKADRLEISKTIKIIDYKTGVVPKQEEVLLGLEPQMPLEALIFSKAYGLPIEALEFWSIKGSAHEDEKIIAIKYDDMDDLIEAARVGIEGLIAKFNLPETAYIARPRPSYALKYNDYEHLARNQEWDS